MKIYDKNLYKSQENIRTVVIVTIAFLLGFFAGYFTNSFSHQNTVEGTNIVQEQNIVEENGTSNDTVSNPS